MNKVNFWIVDAFTGQDYCGNPAGVMVVPEFFDDTQSLRIAAEVNQVETAFIKNLGGQHYHLRWFAPTREVKLCGHATLAAAHILWEEGIEQGDELIFDSLSGPLKVVRSKNGLTLDFPIQKTGPHIKEEAFHSIFNCLPIEVVHAGDDILVELANEDVVRKLQFDHANLLAFDCRAVIVTCRGDQGYDFISRLFAPKIGILEDAVSAAAHCKLADYWMRKTGKTVFKAFQASQRGGEIALEVVKDRVLLTGISRTVVRGEYLL